VLGLGHVAQRVQVVEHKRIGDVVGVWRQDETVVMLYFLTSKGSSLVDYIAVLPLVFFELG
jgi:hypothetical protein